MKPLLLLLLLPASWLFAYSEGERLSKEIQDKLQLQADRVYVIDFFASWCHSCQKEMPLLSNIHSNIDPDKVVMIGVDVDEDVNKGIAFQEKMRREGKLTFQTINDPKGEIIKAFKPIGMPALYIIKDNSVHAMIMGAVADIDTLVLNELKAMP